MDSLAKRAYPTVNGKRAFRAFRAIDGSPGVTLEQISASIGVDEKAVQALLEPMVGAHVITVQANGHYLDVSGRGLLAGYDDTNDAERLSQDPAMRVVVGWQGSDRNAARTNTMSRPDSFGILDFETETLTQEDNLKGLALMNPQWVELAMAHTPHRRVILDMDSSESPVHGQQEGAAYNGHFECVCYHPLFLFNQFGDCEGATLRPGNVHSADGWQELLEPVVKGYQKKGLRLLFRGDAAFAKPELYEYLEQGKIGYAIRLPANQVIQEQIQPLLERPTEWPSREPIVSYQITGAVPGGHLLKERLPFGGLGGAYPKRSEAGAGINEEGLLTRRRIVPSWPKPPTPTAQWSTSGKRSAQPFDAGRGKFATAPLR